MSRPRSSGLIVPLLAVIAGLFPGLASPVRAAEYTLVSRATYDVRPADREIAVTIELTFTNTTPNPSGGFSVFDELSVAIQDQAAEVAAHDADGALDVSVGVKDRVSVATVALRQGLRYKQSVSVVIEYLLPDTADPHLRVRPSLVVFPAWSFGTQGDVTVTLPAGYEVRTDGDPLTADGGSLTSGPIDDPTAWLALVTALQPSALDEHQFTVPLQGGTADVSVRSFSDDPDWGARVTEILTDALPALEREIGLPYQQVGQLVVLEAVAADASGFGEGETSGTEIRVAYDQPFFTAIHEVAHVWLSPTLIDARWIREGLASLVAERVARSIGVDRPYDPSEVATSAADAAIPLDAWTPTADAATERYGYAASWALMQELEGIVGADAIRAVLARVSASIGPYDGSDLAPPTDGGTTETPAAPLTSRALLDQIEAVTSADVGSLFADRVLIDADAALLAPREEARAAYDALVEAADGWGGPDPIRAAMAAWSFDEASSAIAEARSWLGERDGLLAAMQAAGLSAPDRLQQAYRAYGGGPEASDELEAERVVVDRYSAAADGITAPHSFFARLGLIGGADPGAQLALANGRFTDGDLRGALDAIAETQRILAAAEPGGIVRLISLALVVVALAALAIILFRRRASYTARR